MLKKLDKLKQLLDNSTDIESDYIIKHYQRRQKQFKTLYLANFVAWFNYVKDDQMDSSSASNHNESSLTGIDDFLPEANFEDNTDDDPYNINVIECECGPNEYKLKGGMELVKRKKPKIIHSVRFHKDKDPENHFRKQLMLHMPWQKESTGLSKLRMKFSAIGTNMSTIQKY